MLEADTKKNIHYFLQGGGEMGALTRAYDWAKTSVGDPADWPQSLRTTVGLLLHSAFPMFLFWGNDLTCFYNDAFRPSLGAEGKHPALGKPGREVWPEIWDFIGPLIQGVMDSGKPVWYEDQLVPFSRNGKVEEIYWTFSYSPAYDDSGRINGVFVTCTETTEKVQAIKKLTESQKRFQNLVREAPVGTIVLMGEEMRVEIVNAAYGRLVGRSVEELQGKPLFDIIPETAPDFKHMLEEVRTTGKSIYLYDHPYFVLVDGEKREGFLNVIYQPYREEDGNITGVMALCHDVTEQVRSMKKVEASELRMRSLIDSAPAAIGLFLGRDLIVDMHNQAFIDIVGKGDDIMGKPLREVMPELITENQPFLQILDDVYTTGKPFHSYGAMVSIVQQGVMTHNYYNITYSPVFNEHGEVYGILDIAVDVTGEILARKALEESEKQIRSVIEAAPFPIGVYIGEERRILFANETMKRIWGKGDDVMGKQYKEMLPEFASQEVFEQLDSVYNTGTPFNVRNRPLEVYENGTRKLYYINHNLTPLRDTEGNIYGIISTAADVTDLNLAKKQLEESEQNLRNMILQAPVAMCILIGDDHVIEVANDLIIELWGKSKDSVIGKPVFEALPDAREQGLEALMDSVYRNGETFKANEMPVDLVRNGMLETVYLNFVYEPYRSADGVIVGVLAVAIDTTAQVLARKKVEAGEQRVRAIVEAAPFPIAIYSGEEMLIEFANRSIMDVWGKGYDVVGKTYTEVLPELETQEIFSQVQGVYRTGVPFHARNQRVDLVVDGYLQPYYFNYSFTPVYDAEGKIYGVMNTAAEVTDVVVAKQRIEESEKNLRNTILQAPVALCIYRGKDYVIEIANEKMFEFWGVKGEDVIHKPLFQAMPDAANQGFEQIMSNLLVTGEPYTANEMLATLIRDGKPQQVYINFSLEPVHEPDGSISGMMAVATDVTEQVVARHKIEEVVASRTTELADANARLEKSNAELAQFAYIASHDLQEPLRKVATFAQMLEHNLKDIDERSQHYLDKINSAATRMTSLIRDVLTFSQLSQDSVVFEKVNLQDIVAGVISDFELLIDQKQARIICGELPTIDAIPLQMSQLFSNLISNALKFSHEDRPPVITISASVLNSENAISNSNFGETCYSITVADNGIGFEQQYADRIFHIFQRLHGKAAYQGTGIGLAICKKIVQNHRGDIFATAAEGSGAVFNIILPEKQ